MVLKPRDITTDHLKKIGGKASNLLKLYKLGLNVPRWIVIPYDALHEADTSDIIKALPNTTHYAVRSSAIGEDGELHSWAGLFETHLFVTNEHLEEKIHAVSKSVNSPRVKSYAEDKEPPAMAVIVQEMINADRSGVAFSINPVTGHRKQMVVNSLFGLGEGLVNGKLVGDHYLIEGGSVTSNISHKQQKAVHDKEENKGVQYADLEENLKDASSLNKKQLDEISDILRHLYNTTGKYYDMEFSYRNEELFVLQIRPVTTHTKVPDISGRYLVWDNSNIIESYPGITAPLTFSFIIQMYERVYIQLLELFGVGAKSIEDNQHVFSNMLGLFHGRVYYNLYSWYKVLSLLPGYSLNAEFMEKMMGVKERFELKDYEKPSRIRDIFNILKMTVGLFINIRKLPGNTRRFNHHFTRVMHDFQKHDLNSLNSGELMALYRKLEDDLLTKWKPPLVNDFFAMIYFGVTTKLTQEYLEKDKAYLQNDLFRGANDIVSAEPKRLIDEITEAIKKSPSLFSYFKETDSAEIGQSLQKAKENPVYRLINDYLFHYGDRCVEELKLETRTYKQYPEKFIEIIKSHLFREASSVNIDNAKLRKNAEKEVNKALKGKPIKRAIFHHVLKKARVLVSNRENLRFRRTQAYGMVREIFVAIGKRWYAENIITDPDHIFYLTITEIFDFVEGKAITADLQKLIDIRIEEKENSLSIENMDGRFETFGIPYLGNSYENESGLTPQGSSMQGIGCCAGKVKQKVRIVTHPEKAGTLNGEILVTSSTDPGWITLFSSISGIIVERGSLLSHSAIVSRELGIPCIVGVTHALKTLRDGDYIEMDGATGTINIL